MAYHIDLETHTDSRGNLTVIEKNMIIEYENLIYRVIEVLIRFQ
jgi:hypothetical protein